MKAHLSANLLLKKWICKMINWLLDKFFKPQEIIMPFKTKKALKAKPSKKVVKMPIKAKPKAKKK